MYVGYSFENTIITIKIIINFLEKFMKNILIDLALTIKIGKTNDVH